MRVFWILVFFSQREPGYKFKMQATATDKGAVPKSAMMDLEIMVVESHKKAPAFTSVQPQGVIYLPENLTNFSYDIATITATWVYMHYKQPHSALLGTRVLK